MPTGRKPKNYNKALEFVRGKDNVTVTDLQKNLKIGYNPAVKIIERMIADGEITVNTDQTKKKGTRVFDTKKAKVTEDIYDPTQAEMDQEVQFEQEEQDDARRDRNRYRNS